jgi:parvulin-like peptidyl-prolyl isomerase
MPLTVNDEVIPEAAIMHELSRLVHFYSQHMSSEEVRKQMPILKEKAREQAIGAKLLLNDADRLEIKVSDEELTKRLEKVVEESGGKEKFGEILVSQNMTLESLKDSIERGSRVEKLVEKVSSGISDPSEDEMRAHYDGHTAEYSAPERAQARHILIGVEGDNEEEKQDARTRIDEIRLRIADGGDFADEAASHSACPSGQQNGGSLGWFGRGSMVPEFDNAVFSMEIGALSEVIETSVGFHVIEKTAHEDGSAQEYADVRDNVREFLRHAKRGAAISEYVEDLKGKATIENSEG